MTETKPTAVEKLPSLDELFGIDQKAETIALQAAQIALIAREVELQRVTNTSSEDDPIPGFRPEDDGAHKAPDGQHYRTYGQQRRRAEQGLQDLLKQAQKEGVLEKVKELMKSKIDEILQREEESRKNQSTIEAQVNARLAASQNGVVGV